MIEQWVRWSVHNRVLVLILGFALAAAGLQAVRNAPVDAIPDLSDPQVIVRASHPGQAPEVVEQQVTYPLTTTLMAVPGAHTVRGFSMFGDAFIYVLFDEGTDLYWARARVQEYLAQAQGRLPSDARVELGPDATGVGWIYKYALVDRTGEHDLAQLRALQDWFLKYELQGVPGVSEVATVGGMVRQYQVVADPDALRAYGLSLARLRDAIRLGNAEVGGSLIEMAEAEYMVRASGYLQSLDDLARIPLGRSEQGTPILLEDVAEVRRGPAPRRGIAELDGEGEVTGGIIVMRDGENARATIQAVQERLQELASGLPEGVEIVTTYDRSGLIDRAVQTLWLKLALEFLVVAGICTVFLWHFRSALVVLLSLPLGVLVAFIVMQLQGINANIMSLGGIAIAIGVMVDAAIVMIETLHKRLARDPPSADRHWHAVADAAAEVARPIFFSLLMVAVAFLPVFALQAQAGRLFSPLAFTASYALAAAAGIAVTLVPVLMGYLIRGSIRDERSNPVNRGLVALYRPLLDMTLRRPLLLLLAVGLVLGSTLYPLSRIGSEFMPELDEGDLMYMPTTDPGLAPDKARELLQQTNALIRGVPEVERVFGKSGRADTATDPAPLTMFETFITLRPRSQWRDGLTTNDLIAELDERVNLPGLTNAWVFPIQTRIDMLQTGVRTDVGVRISGPDLAVLEALAVDVAARLRELDGTHTAFADRPGSGRYLMIEPDRVEAARQGLSVSDLHQVVRYGIGGANVTETVEGLERFPVNLRLPQEWRATPEALAFLPVATPLGNTVALGEVARLRIADGPAMIRSENTRPTAFVFADVSGRDLGAWLRDARNAVAALELPGGYSLGWTGQYEYLERARAQLAVAVPLVAAVILVLLMLTFRQLVDVLLVLTTVPLALAGGLWLMWALGHAFSVGVAVGFIALGGLAAQTGVVMLVYLNDALARWKAADAGPLTRVQLREAVLEGALARVRPVTMTESTVFLGLLPVMLGTGTGAEVMQRIAAPMVGGVFTVWVTALVVLPVLFYLWHRRYTERG